MLAPAPPLSADGWLTPAAATAFSAAQVLECNAFTTSGWSGARIHGCSFNDTSSCGREARPDVHAWCTAWSATSGTVATVCNGSSKECVATT